MVGRACSLSLLSWCAVPHAPSDRGSSAGSWKPGSTRGRSFGRRATRLPSRRRESRWYAETSEIRNPLNLRLPTSPPLSAPQAQRQSRVSRTQKRLPAPWAGRSSGDTSRVRRCASARCFSGEPSQSSPRRWPWAWRWTALTQVWGRKHSPSSASSRDQSEPTSQRLPRRCPARDDPAGITFGPSGRRLRPWPVLGAAGAIGYGAMAAVGAANEDAQCLQPPCWRSTGLVGYRR